MNKVFIIAEAGVNHNGQMDLAYRLIDVAKAACADAVKFQTAVPELVMTDAAQKANYQKRETGHIESQLVMAKKIHLPLDAYKDLKAYCDKIDILFLSTPFDMLSIDTLEKLNLPVFKIPSGEITNKPYLQRIAKTGKPVIMSTGMADMNEIKVAIDVLLDAGMTLDKITILHCNTQYPTQMMDVNLLAMKTIEKELGVKVGYSDHTLGIEVPIAAVALGAAVIEKHFTLDRNLPGPDHKASLEPQELMDMVKAIRNVELAMSGDGRKIPTNSELENKPIARKSIHLSYDLPADTVLRSEHLVMKRPGDGLSPMDIEKVIGMKLVVALKADTKLKWSDLIK